MEPLILLSEWWWTAAVGIGGITAGGIAVRRRSVRSGRRLEVDAARLDLKAAQQRAVERRMAAKLARAEVTRLSAERSARRATSEQVAGARRMLRDRENDAKAAAADVRAKQVRLSAARAAVPAASAPRPLDRLQAQHDAITAQWMRYETDPALQIAYPAMTDVRQPATAAYARAAGHAVESRRAATSSRTAEAYAEYRDAVSDLERALEAAEYSARVQAGEAPSASNWQGAAHDLISRSTEAIDRAAGVAASAIAAWNDRRKPDRR